MEGNRGAAGNRKDKAGGQPESRRMVIGTPAHQNGDRQEGDDLADTKNRAPIYSQPESHRLIRLHINQRDTKPRADEATTQEAWGDMWKVATEVEQFVNRLPMSWFASLLQYVICHFVTKSQAEACA